MSSYLPVQHAETPKSKDLRRSHHALPVTEALGAVNDRSEQINSVLTLAGCRYLLLAPEVFEPAYNSLKATRRHE
jgi:hypothetical protein